MKSLPSKHVFVAAPAMHGAAIVDENGIETPITDEMVQRSLEELHAAWQRARHRRELTINTCANPPVPETS